MTTCEQMAALRKAIWGVAHSEIRHYIAPGLSSWLVGGAESGKIRLFNSERDTREWITPHSHRFDFTCLVLQGGVTNIIFRRQWGAEGDLYTPGTLKRSGTFGEYEFAPGTEAASWLEYPTNYREGGVYSMTHHEVHSIRFDRGTQVLFIEGPEVTDQSIVLEPWANGKRVPTFVTQPWMFERAAT